MKITRAFVPSFFTALNIFFGFLSIVQSHAGDFYYASIFIMVAAVFDSLDGMVARMTKSTSQFGVELDSLADVVSFGAAPAFLVYCAHLSTIGHWGLLIASFPLIFGAIRLARFNVQLVGFDKEYFNGLPIPMQAITVASFMLSYSTNASGLEEWAKTSLAPIVVVLSLLMVSTIKYDSMPKFSKKAIAAHPWKMGGSVAGAFIIVLSGGSYIFHLASVVIVFGIIRACVTWTRSRFAPKDHPTQQEASQTNIDI